MAENVGDTAVPLHDTTNRMSHDSVELPGGSCRTLATAARSLKRDARDNRLVLSLMARLEEVEVARAAGARVEARLEQRVAELDSLLEAAQAELAAERAAPAAVSSARASSTPSPPPPSRPPPPPSSACGRVDAQLAAFRAAARAVCPLDRASAASERAASAERPRPRRLARPRAAEKKTRRPDAGDGGTATATALTDAAKRLAADVGRLHASRAARLEDELARARAEDAARRGDERALSALGDAELAALRDELEFGLARVRRHIAARSPSG